MDNFNDITEEEIHLDTSDNADTADDVREASDSESTAGSAGNSADPPDELKRTIISDEYTDENIDFNAKAPGRIAAFRSHPDFTLRIAALCIAAIAVSAAFIAGQTVRKDAEAVEESYASQLRQSSRYNELIEQSSSLREENDTLYQERDRVRSEAEALNDYAGKADEIEVDLAAMEDELSRLQADNWAKQAEISDLSGLAAEKTAAAIFSIPPGMYTVGDDDAPPAGGYSVTGSGKFTVSNSGGSVKINTVLTADGTHIVLEDKDKIMLDTRAKFTAAADKPQEGGQ